MAHLSLEVIYILSLSILLAVSVVANVISYFQVRDYKRIIDVYNRQLTAIKQKIRQLPPASRLVKGLPVGQLKLITNNKSRNIVNKLLSPRKDK